MTNCSCGSPDVKVFQPTIETVETQIRGPDGRAAYRLRMEYSGTADFEGEMSFYATDVELPSQLTLDAWTSCDQSVELEKDHADFGTYSRPPIAELVLDAAGAFEATCEIELVVARSEPGAAVPSTFVTTVVWSGTGLATSDLRGESHAEHGSFQVTLEPLE